MFKAFHKRYTFDVNKKFTINVLQSMKKKKYFQKTNDGVVIFDGVNSTRKFATF